VHSPPPARRRACQNLHPLGVLVILILALELLCLIIYAPGGRTLNRFMHRGGHIRTLNRITCALIVGVGIWPAVG